MKVRADFLKAVIIPMENWRRRQRSNFFGPGADNDGGLLLMECSSKGCCL